MPSLGKHPKASYAAFVLIAIHFAFFSATLRSGHDWGGDFAMYVHHAKNLAEGLPYAQTGYIYDPANPSIGPKVYPPVFPLLLAPVYRAFGLNLMAMKVEILLFFELFLFLFWLTIRTELPPALALATVAILGFNPFFWEFKDHVLSDIPFTFFTYVGLFLIAHYGSSPPMQKRPIAGGVLAGACLYLAYGTRTIGVVLVPALLAYEWLRQKKLSKFALVAVAVCGLFIGLQSALLHASGSYLQMFTLTPQKVMANLVSYAKSTSPLWENGYTKWPQALLFFGMYGLAFIGFLKRWTRRPAVYELFLLLYLGCVIVWPYDQGLRLLIPILPLFLFYAFFGVNELRFFKRKQWQRWLAPALVALIAASYVGAYSRTDFGPIREGIGNPETGALFRFLGSNTTESDVFIFSKPRVLSLFTGRSASVYPLDRNDLVLWKYFRSIRATYLVTSPIDDPAFPQFISRYPGDLKSVFSNADFGVYRILHFPQKNQPVQSLH